MSHSLNLKLQVTGLTDWQTVFAEYLGSQTNAEALIVAPNRIPGAAGSSNDDQLVVKENTDAVKKNTTVAYVGAILTAVSLTLSQLDKPKTYYCMIQGEYSTERIEVTNELSAKNIEDALSLTGEPYALKILCNEN